MSDLQDRTRWEPAEAEARIFARWLESGLFHPEAAGTAAENFSIAVPPPNVTGRAAHGPRAQRLGPGHPDPLPPHARPAHEVDARHRPRGHRHADAGREAARARGHVARGARPRGVHRARLALARGVRRDHLRPVPAPRRVDGLRGGALHARPGLRARRAEGLRRPLRQGPDLPRQLHGQLGPGLALGDLRPRGRGPRGPGHPLLRRLPARERRRLASPSPPCGPRRCSPTPRSPCTRTTSATRGSWGRRRSCRSWGAGCGSSPTPT